MITEDARGDHSLFAELASAQTLVPRPWGWMSIAVIGSLMMAALDMAGVAAMLPLMQVVSGSPPTAVPLAWIAEWTGSTDPQHLTIATALAVGVAFTCKSLFTMAFRWWLLGRTTGLEADASKALMARYTQSSMLGHRRRELAEITRTLNTSVPQTFSQVVLGLMSIVAEALTLLAIGAVLVITSPVAAALGIAFFGILGLVLQRVLRRAQHDVGHAMGEADVRSWRSLMPVMQGFRELRLAGVMPEFRRRFGAARQLRASAGRRLSILGELPKYILEVGIVVAIGGIAVMLFATRDSAAALAVLGVFAAGSTRMLPSLNRLLASFATVRTGRAGLTQLAGELRSLDADPGFTEEPPFSTFDGDIGLEDVGFQFPDGNERTLAHVTTTIVAGRTTAIVGPSGSGKSTLLDIVLGLLPPTTGRVTCGGRDITDDLAGWHRGLGVVPQDVYLVDDTLEANIAFDGHPVDPDRIAEAVQLAQLDLLLAELPDGLATRMGERGVRLSGGQRQRVGIARALYRNPSVLVLDEATSALDNATEQRITQTIASLRGRMTIIVVAHRLSTVRDADHVVFLSHGRIEAEGTFAEVESTSPDFAHLVALGRL